VLLDFFLGAHSVVTGAVLATRNAPRYRSCFSGILLASPN
jgi:hypothetical protein